MPPPGLDKLKHIVVLMMENRSFDHMLGGLKAQDPRIEGLTGQSNFDTSGAAAVVKAQAAYQGQLDPIRTIISPRWTSRFSTATWRRTARPRWGAS